MTEVTLTGHIVVPESDLAAVEAALPEHIELTLQEPGCIEFSVVRDTESPRIFHVSERFVSSESFLLHQDRAKRSAWGEVSANVERHYTTTGLDNCK